MSTIDVEALLAGRAEIPLRELAPLMGMTPRAALLRRDRGTLPVRVHQERPGRPGRRGSIPLVSDAEVRRFVAERTHDPAGMGLSRLVAGQQIFLAVTPNEDGDLTLSVV